MAFFFLAWSVFCCCVYVAFRLALFESDEQREAGSFFDEDERMND